MKLKNLVLTSLAVAALVGCGGGGSPTPTGSENNHETIDAHVSPVTSVVFKPVAVSSCDKSFALLMLGDYALNSNPWGKDKITDFTQCVSGASVGTVLDNTAIQTGATAQFRWDWPSENSNADIKAYPEILYRPGGKGMTSIPFADVAGLSVTHDVTISATGDYNVTYDIWVDSTATTDHWPHKAEIMIKLQQTWKDAPVIDTIAVDGNQFEVFEHTVINASYNWKWKVLVFASKTPLLKASIPLKPFIDYLVSKNHLLQTDYISTIEFGAELKRGKGMATINSYSVSR
ncbi:MAG: hypothetical protein HHJ09_00210 [Glaciimonas sp.]|nr:hypothetical protein [Glaciimonas sp.]